MPYIEYVPHRFSPAKRAQIEFANSIIRDYSTQGLTLTLRQLYYRFVAAGKIPNTIQSYDTLGKTINDARLAALIDWSAIEDRTRNLSGYRSWSGPEERLIDAAATFHLDWWKGQPERVEIWVEKEALAGVIAAAAQPLDVPFFSCRGYVSQSEMWEAGQRFLGYRRAKQRPVIIHLGDHDPSGIDMTRDITDRLRSVFKVDVEIQRIALNMDQIEKYQTPPNPAKMTDCRYKGYSEIYGDESWELDALEPKTLRVMITKEVEAHIHDPKLFRARIEQEAAGRAQIARISQNYDNVLEFLNKPKRGK